MHTILPIQLGHLPPFFRPTCSLAFGIFVHHCNPGFSFIACIVAAIALCFNDKNKQLIGILCAFILGIASATWQRMPLHDHFPSMQNTETFGTITDYEYVPHARMKHRLCLRLTRYKNDHTWHKTNHLIQLYCQQKPECFVGDYVHMANITCKQEYKKDFQRYLLKSGISATGFATKLDVLSVARPYFCLNRTLHLLKNKLARNIKRHLSAPTHTLLFSVFLGNKTSVKKKLECIQDDFKQWGLAHYLARSGLHLVIFVLLWVVALRFAPLPFALKHWLLLFLCALYFILSWPSTSFLRAFFTLFVYKVCILTDRPTHFLHVLTLLCFCFLLCNPIQLFFLDFQLSFGLTCALAWFGLIQHNARTQNT